MKRATGKFLAAASLAVGLSPLANAGLLSIEDGTAYNLPNDSSHDVAVTKGAPGYLDGYLKTTAQPLPVYLTFEFLGYEAGYTNEFSAYGDSFVNKTASVGDKFYATESGDTILDFAFTILSGATGSVANGDPNDNFTNAPNFFLGYVNNDPNSNAVYIALDDGGASNDDDNHDDLVLKVTARVPEPASVALLGLGLVGLGVARRRHTA